MSTVEAAVDLLAIIADAEPKSEQPNAIYGQIHIDLGRLNV